jgi:hypothetical protein
MYSFHPHIELRQGIVYPNYFTDGAVQEPCVSEMLESVKEWYSDHIAKVALAMCTELTTIRVAIDPVRKLPSIEFTLKDPVDKVVLGWMILVERWPKGPSNPKPFKWEGRDCRVYGRWTAMIPPRGITETLIDIDETTKVIDELIEKRAALRERLALHVLKSPEYKRALRMWSPYEAADHTIETARLRAEEVGLLREQKKI